MCYFAFSLGILYLTFNGNTTGNCKDLCFESIIVYFSCIPYFREVVENTSSHMTSNKESCNAVMLLFQKKKTRRPFAEARGYSFSNIARGQINFCPQIYTILCGHIDLLLLVHMFERKYRVHNSSYTFKRISIKHSHMINKSVLLCKK